MILKWLSVQRDFYNLKTKKMTRTQALTNHLINGGKLSIKNAFLDFGISNVSREIRRLVEIPNDVTLDRETKVAKTKYGSTCYYFEYSASEKTKEKLLQSK